MLTLNYSRYGFKIHNQICFKKKDTYLNVVKVCFMLLHLHIL